MVELRKLQTEGVLSVEKNIIAVEKRQDNSAG